MLSMFRSSRARSAPAEPSPVPETPQNEVNVMESMFSANFSQLQLRGSAPLPSQRPESSRRSTLRRSRARSHLQPHPRLVSREPAIANGHQPFRMLFFGVHGGRLFSGRMRRGAQFQDITYESMLALDEDNPRRAVKAHVLNSLHKGVPQKGSEDCLVCMDAWPAGPQHIQLPCAHSFCEPCTRSWLEANNSCPVCRWQFSDNDTYLLHRPASSFLSRL